MVIIIPIENQSYVVVIYSLAPDLIVYNNGLKNEHPAENQNGVIE